MGANIILDDIINVINDKINTNGNARITGEILNNVLIDICNFTDSKVTKEENKQLSSNNFTDNDKNKLESIAEGAQVNVIETVKVNNVSLPVTNKSIDISIPNVTFKAISDTDKVLTLTEGVLSSSLSFGIDEIAREDGKKYLYVTGIDGTEIGKVDTADFVVDGMLESVAVKEDNPNILVFTWNADSGKEVTEIDFSKYVDVYKADGTTLTLDSATNTFSVKGGVFDAYGSASGVQTDLNNYKTTTDTALTEINDKLYTLNIIIPSGISNGQNNNSIYEKFNVYSDDLEKIQTGKVGTVYIRDERLNTYAYGNISYYTSGGTSGYGGLSVSYVYANKIIIYEIAKKYSYGSTIYIRELTL